MNANSIGAPVSATPATSATPDNEYNHISSSRRALLIGAAILPLSVCPTPSPVAPSATDLAWVGLCAAYDAALRHMQACMTIFNERERAWLAAGGFGEPTPALGAAFGEWIVRKDEAERRAIGDAEDAMTSAESVATNAFMAVRDYPVQSYTALAAKAEYMAERYGDDLEGSEARALIADIRRLAGREA